MATLEVHDFRQPRQLMPTSWRTLQRWYEEGCELIAERWKKLGLEVTLSHHHTRVLSLRNALEVVPEPGWGVQGALGATSIPTLLSCSPRRLRSLVNGLMGDTSEETTEVESLTAVEESMAELLFHEFLQAVGDAWPGAEPLSCRLTDTLSQPQRTRIYLPRTTMIVTTLHLHSVSGEPVEKAETDESDEQDEGENQSPAEDERQRASEIVWIMPQQEIEDLIEIECAISSPQPAKPHPDIPRIMREVPVSITVELGRTCLSMSEITSLQTGDVVILEQSVNRPLNALVGDTFKFRGRPGRIGSHRCLEIQQVLEDVPGTPTTPMHQ